jgi:glutamate N-acetyltransferase / amino-acid N-acetyltransferase
LWPQRRIRRQPPLARSQSVAETVVARVKAPNPVSPLAPAAFPDLPVIDGAEFAAAAAGVRYQGRTDVMLVRLAPGTAIAGAFTRSSTRRPACWTAQAKLSGKATAEGAAILVNSGNANAFTGAAGQASVDALTGAVGARLGLPAARVFTSSTGVIGEPLPHDRIARRLMAWPATCAPTPSPAPPAPS